MSLLSFLGPALTAGTQAASGALAGQEAGRNEATSKMMALIAQTRAQHEQELKDQLTTADIGLKKAQTDAGGFRPNQAPQAHWDEARGAWVLPPGGAPPTPPASSPSNDPTGQAAPPKPAGVVVPQGLPDKPQPKTPRSFTEDGKAVEGFSDPTGKFYRGDGTPATGKIGVYTPPGNNTYITGVGPDGKPTIFAGSTKGTPNLTDTGVGKPAAGGAAGGQRLPERTEQLGLALHNAAEALPFHDESEANGSPGIVSGFLAQHSQSGSLPARGALNLTESGQRYEKYIDAINGSLLAVAHSVGGARISKEQVNMFGGNMMVSPNDPPATVQQKTRAIIDFMNSARATLPPDAVAQQEASMSAAGLAYLKSKGYGAAPSAQGVALVNEVKALGGEPGTEAAPTDKVGKVRAALQAGTVKPVDVANSTTLTPAEKKQILMAKP